MGRKEGKERGTKKTKEDKIAESQAIKDMVMKYQRIFVIKLTNKKADHLNDIRRRFRSSYLCLAKKKIIGYALGTTEETSLRPNIYQLNQYIGENCALFMTDESFEDVIQFMKSLTRPDYATTGFIATETFVVPAGHLTQFPYSMDSHLRELGLPVQLDNGTINNIRDYEVCHVGQPITKNAAELLNHFGKMIATFSADPIAMWQNDEVTTPNS